MAGVTARAASGAAQFTVAVHWQPHPTGICISDTQSEQSGAVVRVVCASGQFVSIEPTPGRPFSFTHGGAYRYHFGPGYSPPEPAGTGQDDRAFSGTGTVTAMRLQRSGASGDERAELLITF